MTIFVAAQRRRRARGSDRRDAEARAAPSSAIAPSGSSARSFAGTRSAAGLDIVVVPRREMLDAAYRSLEAEYRAASIAATAPPGPARPAVGAVRSRSACFAPTSCCCRRSLRARAAFCRPAPTTWREAIRDARRCCAAAGSALDASGRCHPFGGHGFDPVPRDAELIRFMEKRVLLAVSCRSWCCTRYQALFPPPKRRRPAAGRGDEPALPRTAPAAVRPERLRGADAGTAAQPAARRAAAAAGRRRAAERDDRRREPAVSAVFTNRGGALTAGG